MEIKYCWRCKKDAPFLNEEEFEEIYNLYSKCQNIMQGFREAQNSPIKETPVDHLFKPVRDAYEKITGWKETNHNAIMHHRLSSLGLDCPTCKKPLRTPQATSCPECSWKKEVPKLPHQSPGDVRPSTLLRVEAVPVDYETRRMKAISLEAEGEEKPAEFLDEASKAFLDLAKEFCSWVEASPAPKIEEIRRAIRLLAKFYHQALVLSPKDPGRDIEIDNPSSLDSEKLLERFGGFPFQNYWEFYFPSKLENGEPCMGDFIVDMIEIYGGLKEGLFLHQKGYPKEAFWKWKNSFRTHLGRHALSALHALHGYMDEKMLDL